MGLFDTVCFVAGCVTVAHMWSTYLLKDVKPNFQHRPFEVIGGGAEEDDAVEV